MEEIWNVKKKKISKTVIARIRAAAERVYAANV
jgi:hypothetical protein